MLNLVKSIPYTPRVEKKKKKQKQVRLYIEYNSNANLASISEYPLIYLRSVLFS